MERAKREGKRLGRPEYPFPVDEIKKLLNEGWSVAKIHRYLVSVGKICRETNSGKRDCMKYETFRRKVKAPVLSNILGIGARETNPLFVFGGNVEGDIVRLIQKLTKRIAELESRNWYKEAVKYKQQQLKVERRKQRTWQHCFISDLHCESLYFDAPAFKTMLKRLVEEKLRCEVLHVVGDVVEGKSNHSGQLYESFLFSVQRSVAVRSIVKLVEVLRPKVIHIIPLFTKYNCVVHGRLLCLRLNTK